MGRTTSALERGEVVFCESTGTVRFQIVSVNNREKFILYELDGNKRKKIGEAQDPIKLETKYDIMSRIRERC